MFKGEAIPFLISERQRWLKKLFTRYARNNNTQGTDHET